MREPAHNKALSTVGILLSSAQMGSAHEYEVAKEERIASNKKKDGLS
ncbi:hypothetical protein JD969_02045 [Planctomycetota bacterium]|nr:hypothetical protein JD969_02045 [Planctomycetota bacterium]